MNIMVYVSASHIPECQSVPLKNMSGNERDAHSYIVDPQIRCLGYTVLFIHVQQGQYLPNYTIITEEGTCGNATV